MKLRFRFGLRRLFVLVTAWAVLLAQWPLVEHEPQRYVPLRVGYFPSMETTVVSKALVVEGGYFVPARVVVIATLEVAALIGWLIWRRFRRRAATKT
jgi:hypothetical protein